VALKYDTPKLEGDSTKISDMAEIIDFEKEKIKREMFNDAFTQILKNIETNTGEKITVNLPEIEYISEEEYQALVERNNELCRLAGVPVLDE